MLTVDGVRKTAHRWAYEQTYGPIPDGRCIMHRCDTPACYYAPHLRAGTARENMLDAIAKGRARVPPHRDDRAPCPKGHVGEIARKKDGKPTCRACNREYAQRSRNEKLAAEGRENGAAPRRFSDDEPCPRGHVGEFSRPRSGKRWRSRICRVCARERARAKRRALREATSA